MGITRSQYIQGNSGDGTVLPLVQGVTAGAGVAISSSGVLSLTPATTAIIGGVIPDGTTIKVNPAGVISTNDAAFFRQIDDIAAGFNGVQTVFNLTVGGLPYTPFTADNLLISLGGVLQIPGPAFTVSGSTIQFSSAPPANTTFSGYVIVNGPAGGSGGGPGTVTSVGTGTGLSGGPIVTTGTITLDIATTATLGGVIADGTTITVSGAGVISAVPPTIPVPRIVNLGVIEAINGTNTTFTLCEYGTTTPYLLTIPTNLAVFLGGIPQLPGTAYTVFSNLITFDTAPPTGCTFLAITVVAV